MDVILPIVFIIVLISCSAFFSGSETSLMALNRYRLRHLAKNKHKAAKRTIGLLKRPDRILGVILIGNTFANILASAIATILAERWLGQFGLFASTIILTLIILIFAEVMPKTLAAIYPEKFAFPASYALKILLWLLYPVAWLANTIVNLVLKLFGILIPKSVTNDPLTKDELHSVVTESGATLTRNYRNMLLGILELENITVSDVMLPRRKVDAVDLDLPVEDILKSVSKCQHRKVIAYRNDIDQIIGVLNVHRVLGYCSHKQTVSKSDILKLVQEAYYIPQSVSLQTQLLKFQQRGERFAIVVDEYGSFEGIITTEDIIEEIVGEFADTFEYSELITKLSDQSYIVAGSITIRELNRHLNLKLPTKGPNTLSGLITEHLETIPSAPCCLKINSRIIEITKVSHNMIEKARIYPKS
ncbi:HlyC/CorC family transporter [Thiotrichales bacterium 19S11-10]|nr:HlyC/CorC family transporter [Thiotrichales bacterium 19S11-10]MCF6807926.1 HlyC/CorC family transporter [Thiotrichales bacterium 19S9-11]MCF6811941.1 HlyC/CorC family transporter [Thiotrichales bacterium 19S9-12]